MKRTSERDRVSKAGPLPRASTIDQRRDDRAPETMDAEHRSLIMLGLDAVRNGDIASEEEVEAVLARSRL